MANGGAHREAPAPIVRPVNNEGAGLRSRAHLIERDTDPTRLSPDNATMMIAVLCIDNQVE